MHIYIFFAITLFSYTQFLLTFFKNPHRYVVTFSCLTIWVPFIYIYLYMKNYLAKYYVFGTSKNANKQQHWK